MLIGPQFNWTEQRTSNPYANYGPGASSSLAGPSIFFCVQASQVKSLCLERRYPRFESQSTDHASIARQLSLVEQEVHTLQVIGSNPILATNYNNKMKTDKTDKPTKYPARVCTGCLNKVGVRSTLCKDCNKLRTSIFPMDSLDSRGYDDISVSDFYDVLNPTGKTPARITEE